MNPGILETQLFDERNLIFFFPLSVQHRFARLPVITIRYSLAKKGVLISENFGGSFILI